MKKTLTFILLWLPIIMVSQSNYPLVKDGAIWREGVGYQTPEYSGYDKIQFQMQGDTMLFGKTYKKVFETNYDSSITTKTYVGAMREDSLSRVYFVKDSTFGGFFESFPAQFTDTNEVMLYDFSLTVNDTFINPASARDSITVVESIDSVLINGSYRQRYRVEDSNYISTVYWIEGIGSTKGLFSTAFYEFEWVYYLNCYEDSNLFWTNPEISLGCFEVSVEEKKQEPSKLHVYPNPAAAQFTVASESFRIKSIELYNLSGQLILRKEANNKQVKVNIMDHHPGLYFVKIKTGNGVRTQKINIVK